MGIPKFARFLMARYPLILRKVKTNIDIPEIDNLYLDINGIIHNVSHNNDIITACMNKTHDDIYRDTCNMIHSIISLIKPTKFVMISADGVAPRAKMNQQRSRRFRKETIPQDTMELLMEQGYNLNNMFDSNCISAGTEFMYNLSIYMNKYIEEKKKEDKLWQSLEILFTGSDVPGEGEHKILEYIRNYKSSPQYQQNIKHCIYGLDADLIMLSLITHEPNIVILREDSFLKKKQKEKEPSTSSSQKEEFYEFILVSVLREYLELEFIDLVPKLSFKFNLERIIDDFIFFCFFIGNDFLPNLNSLDIETGALENIFAFYKKCLPTLNDYITYHGKIDFTKAKSIFKLLSIYEKRNLAELVESIKDTIKENKAKKRILIKEKFNEVKEKEYTVKKGKLYNSLKQKGQEAKNAFKRNKKNKQINHLQKIYEMKVKTTKTFKEEVDIYYNQQDLIKKEKEKKINDAIVGLFDGEDDFKRKEPPKKKAFITEKSTPQEILEEAILYKKYIDDETYCSDLKFNEISNSDVSEIDKKEILTIVMNLDEIKDPFQYDNDNDIEDVNKRFMETLYNYVVTDINRAKEFYYKEKLHFDINTPEGKSEKEKMFVNYLEGLQWVLYYYYRGIRNWKWYYPYHYAPLISDFVDYDYSQKKLDELFFNDNTQPFEPFLSLLFILPKCSFNLLPSCYSNIPDELEDLYPLKYEIDYNGKRTPWESITLIPFLDEQRIIDIEKKYSQLSEEEKQRNKWGDSYLYFKNVEIPEIKKEKYAIYQTNNPLLKSNYEHKKTDCTFPTLSSIIYDYSMEEFKLYYGKNVKRTNRIYIYPLTSYRTFTPEMIHQFLNYPYIFVNYPYKTNAKLLGFVYQRKYFYLYKGEPYIDTNFKLSEDIVTKIDNEQYKKGLRITFKDILCNVVLFKGTVTNKNGKISYQYDEKNPIYVPFEITSLNYKSGEMKALKKKFDGNFKTEQNKENEDKVKGNKEVVSQQQSQNKKEINQNQHQQYQQHQHQHQQHQQYQPYQQYQQYQHQQHQQMNYYNQANPQKYNYNEYGTFQNYNNKYEEHEGKKKIMRNQVKIDKKFKTFPEGIELQRNENKIIGSTAKNVSEYRENRIFQNEKLKERQLYYFPINEAEEGIKQNTNIIIRTFQ